MPLAVWLKEMYSYAGQELVVSAQTQLDVLLLGMLWVGPSAGLAAYGLAMRFYYAIGMPFESLGTAVLPRVAMREPIAWRNVLRWAVPVGIAAIAGMMLATSLGTLFGLSPLGASYLRTIGMILLLALPFRFASYVLGAVVTGSGRQRARLISATLGLATMVGLDAALIPVHGPAGAAAALVCADAVLMTAYAAAARKALQSLSA
jgi:Na+-driven multidrug efflux pump